MQRLATGVPGIRQILRRPVLSEGRPGSHALIGGSNLYSLGKVEDRFRRDGERHSGEAKELPSEDWGCEDLRFGAPASHMVLLKMKTPSLNRQRKSSPSVAPAGAEGLLSPLTACLLAVALVAGVFAIYSPALHFQFVLDDHRFVGDPRLQSPGHLGEYFTSYVWAQVPGGPLSFYRPLFVLWMRLNFILSGLSPWGWHLLSIVKHVAVAVLLGWLVWKLLRDRVAAFMAATLFALHPAQTESVAWVTVPDPLMSAAGTGPSNACANIR